MRYAKLLEELTRQHKEFDKYFSEVYPKYLEDVKQFNGLLTSMRDSWQV